MAQIEAAQTAAGVESLMKLPEEEAVVYNNKAAEAEADTSIWRGQKDHYMFE